MVVSGAVFLQLPCQLSVSPNMESPGHVPACPVFFEPSNLCELHQGSSSKHSCAPPLQSSLLNVLPWCEVLCFFAPVSPLRLCCPSRSRPNGLRLVRYIVASPCDEEEYTHGHKYSHSFHPTMCVHSTSILRPVLRASTNVRFKSTTGARLRGAERIFECRTKSVTTLAACGPDACRRIAADHGTCKTPSTFTMPELFRVCCYLVECVELCLDSRGGSQRLSG